MGERKSAQVPRFSMLWDMYKKIFEDIIEEEHAKNVVM
jgi:hypothetical protein